MPTIRSLTVFRASPAALAVLCLSLLVGLSGCGSSHSLSLGVEGPAGVSTLAPPTPTPLSTYGADDPSRLSVLVSDPHSDWLSLAHGLKAIGVPFSLTTDYRVALRHRVILVYPQISGNSIAQPALRALAAWARAGGTLIGTNVVGGLNQLFGFSRPIQGHDLVQVRFVCGDTAPCDFSGKAEVAIRIGDHAQPEGIIGTVAYAGLSRGVTVLARYETGAAAVISRHYGKGETVALGLDIGELLRQGYANRSLGVERSYVNTYQPTSDVFLRLLRGLYELRNPAAVSLSPTPNGKQLTVLLTHDVDFYPSFENSVAFAGYEHAAGVPATYFIQTKYITDWEDKAFLTPENITALKRVRALGMELDSHTVSHANDFDTFPEGDGTESYPDYRPTTKNSKLTKHGTVMGEARVSRFLLERVLGVKTVAAFRSGYLRNPPTLAETLQATGYSFSSTTTANDSLTHLPFETNRDRDAISETNVFEFAITIEDGQPPALPNRLGAAIRVAHGISREQGTFVVLIHPNITGFKLDFERKLVAAIKPFSYFATVGGYGRWWQARNAVTTAVRAGGRGTATVTLTVPRPLSGLTVDVPAGRRLASVEGTTATQQGDAIVLGRAQGTVTLTLR